MLFGAYASSTDCLISDIYSFHKSSITHTNKSSEYIKLAARWYYKIWAGLNPTVYIDMAKLKQYCIIGLL